MSSHCAECGMYGGPGAVYHPYLFCVLYKAGKTDPALFLAQSGWQRIPEPFSNGTLAGSGGKKLGNSAGSAR